MNRYLIVVFLACCNSIFGQNISGRVMDIGNKKPIEFANIGIAGKNVGTVTDFNGRFNLFVDPDYDNDTILFSIIGYQPLSIKIADLRKNSDNEVFLKEKAYDLVEVIIIPKKYIQRTIGVTTKSRMISAGFKDNKLGYECGVLIKVKKTALIKKVNINIFDCSYDSIFYRLNIYRVNGKMNFENMLREPIYIRMAKESVRDEIQIDLQSKEIMVEGDFLITLEHVKDIGDGYLNFCAGFKDKTYYRKTSQGKWETVPVGISISVVADVEK